MPAIPLANAMIVWTPNRGVWLTAKNCAPPGSIAVVHGPDDRNAWTRYPLSYGFCNADYQQGDDAYRLQRLADLLEQFKQQDNMDMSHVIEAFRAIEGIEQIKDYKGKSPQGGNSDGDD